MKNPLLFVFCQEIAVLTCHEKHSFCHAKKSRKNLTFAGYPGPLTDDHDACMSYVDEKEFKHICYCWRVLLRKTLAFNQLKNSRASTISFVLRVSLRPAHHSLLISLLIALGQSFFPTRQASSSPRIVMLYAAIKEDEGEVKEGRKEKGARRRASLVSLPAKATSAGGPRRRWALDPRVDMLFATRVFL